MIKVALAMKHGLIPRSLHFREPNPHIPFDELHLRVQQELGPWPTPGRLLAGVNSFGFGGTNAHVIMESPPEPEASAEPASSATRPLMVPLSARSPEALRAMARVYAELIGSDTEEALEDIAWTASWRRTHHEYRLALVASSKEDLRDGLHAYADEKTDPRVVSGDRLSRESPKTAFVFAGQGPQWWAMGRELLAKEPVFRKTIERCDELLRSEGDWSLLEELCRDETASRLHETAIAQPAIFSLQVALAALWGSWGIRPDATVGHSVGEVAAAHLAGGLSLEDAIRVIFHRGRCMDFAAAHGKMLAVGLPAGEALDLIRGREHEVSLAAVNSPSAVTLSGEPAALHEIAQELVSDGTFHRFLKVNYAFHSPLMDPMREALLDALSGINPEPVSLPMVSTVTGLVVNGPELDAEYWWRNVRRSVQFAPAVETLLDDGCEVFVELSPHPVLTGSILECGRDKAKSNVTALHSLRREEPERGTMLKALASLYTLGAPVDWAGVIPEGRFVDLPRYPWQRQRYWAESEESVRSRLAEHVHPLLGNRIAAANPTWQNSLDVRSLRFLNDHRVQGHVVLPATCYLEMAASAIAGFYGEGPSIIEELELGRVFFLADSSATAIQAVLDPEESTIRVFARGADAEKPWTKHASAKVRWAPDLERPEALDLAAIRERCPKELSSEECYTLLSSMGLDYGASFRGIEKVWAGRGEVLGHIVSPPELDRGWEDYRLHPAVMDACLQMIAGLFGREGTRELGVFLPVGFEQVRVYAPAEKKLWGHARVVTREARSVVADLSVLDEAGRPVVGIKGLRCQAIDEAMRESLEDLVYEYEWRLAELEDASSRGSASLASPGALGARARAGRDSIRERSRPSTDRAGFRTGARPLVLCVRLESARRARGRSLGAGNASHWKS